MPAVPVPHDLEGTVDMANPVFQQNVAVTVLNITGVKIEIVNFVPLENISERIPPQTLHVPVPLVVEQPTTVTQVIPTSMTEVPWFSERKCEQVPAPVIEYVATTPTSF